MMELLAPAVAALGQFGCRLALRLVGRRPARRAPPHPPEGYPFDDPSGPTHEERLRALWGWESTPAPPAERAVR